MSLLGKASLVMTPNAIKESKVYSIIPSSGNGDFTFTRATTATLNNDAGLIENVPYNLLNYSEQFGNASWSNTELNVSGTPPYLNQGASPNGSVTATKIIPNTVGGVHRFVYGPTITTSAGSSYTISIFMKKNDFNYCFFRENINGTTDNSFFNLQTVTLGTIGAGRTATIQDFGNGWIRCSVTATTTTTSINVIGIGVTDTNGNTTVIGDNIKFNYLWGAQLVQGSVPKDYFFTTDRLNVPRLNYDTVGGCPALLLEPQRTNLLLNSVWGGGGTIPTSWSANFATGTSTPTASIKNPNVTAYRFVTTSAQRQEFNQQFIFSSTPTNPIICFSVYVESVTTAVTVFQLLRINPTITGAGTTVFLKNNVVIASGTNIEAGNTYSIQYTVTASDTFQFRIGSGVNNAVAGNFVLSMPQLETGVYPTSYIPTTSGSVTRNADVCSKSGISDLIGQTEGVMFIESAALFNDLTSRYISISDGTSNNRILLFYNNVSNVITLASVSNGTTVIGGLSYTISDETQFAKIAVRYSNTLGYSLWVNGVNRISSALNTLPLLMSRFGFDSSSGGSTLYAKVKQVQLYKTYLTDTEMTALTTL